MKLAAVFALIHALLAPYDYYPTALPPEIRYVSWSQSPLSPKQCGKNVIIEFAGGGHRLEWFLSRSCDDRGIVACRSSGYPGYGFGLGIDVQSARLNGRQVYFSVGNHGSNAWACIPLHTTRGPDVAVVGIWESNFMTPREAMHLVAYARPYR